MEKKPNICPKCNLKNKYVYWCHRCLPKHFQAEFSNWSSGNQVVDKFIQEIQLNVTEWAQHLEWIPYERLVNVHYIAKGGYGKVYSAVWLDGPKAPDKDFFEIFCRKENHPVALKSINYSKPTMEGFFSELNNYIDAMKGYDGYNDLLRYYGITQNPETKEYMMVTQFANQGALRNSLGKLFGNNMLWKTKLYLLMRISCAILTIHRAGLVHRDLHSGNILLDDDDIESSTLLSPMTRVSDLGLTSQIDSIDDNIFGVLPYIAPEVLLKKPYTQCSDVYSFGILMWEVASGQIAFSDQPHDFNLAMRICQGLRPPIVGVMPEFFLKIMRQCWDENPTNRPTIRKINGTLNRYIFADRHKEELNEPDILGVCDKARPENSNQPISKLHDEAVYTSRSMNFKNLSVSIYDTQQLNLTIPDSDLQSQNN